MVAYQQKSGFTLIELILATGIITILVMISIPILNRYVQRNDLDVAASAIVQDLYRAQNLARNGENGGNWGVYIQSGSITVFQGNSYASRIQSKDEVFGISPTIATSGTNEYVFSSFTGTPIATGSSTIQKNSDTKTVTVNAKGVIEY
ncbi:type II secretion system protein [Candidatus Saccharibacteria bacterium]|nr:type II secretion system protein [Candidatus Saccharibacteria bacterium]